MSVKNKVTSNTETKKRKRRQSVQQLSSHLSDVLLSREQQSIYDALARNEFTKLNNLVARYLYTLPSYIKNMTINVRKSIELCSNLDALKRVVEIRTRQNNWPCCSLCGIQIEQNMQIEHTIPTTLFRLLFSGLFCINTPISMVDFNHIMCGNFNADDIISSVIHLTIGVSHDVCNQIKGRDFLIQLRIDEGGIVQILPDMNKINAFANRYYSTFANGGKSGYMPRRRFVDKVTKIFPDTSLLYNTVLDKTQNFIQQMCVKFNLLRINEDMLRGNVSSLANSDLKYEKGELKAIDLFNVNYEDPNFIKLQELCYIRENRQPAMTITRSGRFSKPIIPINPSYTIYVPKTISTIKNPAEQEREVDDYIISLSNKLEINPLSRCAITDGRGIITPRRRRTIKQTTKRT